MIQFGYRQLQEILPSSRRKLAFSFKPLSLKGSILSAFASLRASYEYACILESASGPERVAELSIIVFDPIYVLSAPSDRRITLEDRQTSNTIHLDEAKTAGEGGVESEDREHRDPLRVLSQIVKSHPSSNTEFRFAGGAVGYISYDAVRHWEKSLGGGCKGGSGFPDMQFAFYDQGIIFDHRIDRAYYFFSDRGKDRLKEIQEIVGTGPNYSAAPLDAVTEEEEIASNLPFSFSKPRSNVKQETFESSVRRAKEYIRNGDVFQVVLSKRYKFNFSGDLLRFYSEIRSLNPSPYMYFLDFGDEAKIVGSSPEMLVRIEAGTVETFPIAGTRPRTSDEIRNAELAEELLSDPKERAEHIMLVDLARNDVGRVAEFGTVSVPEFMEVKRFSHVQHIVSHVVGKLKDGLDCFQALRSIFPAGTVSGAPKIRAMQIIDELETEKRGPYAGAVGYFSFNGNIDSAIAIRTLVARANEASVQAGAGIVADSDPTAEWFETEHKSRALFNALKLSAMEKMRGEIR